MPFARGIVQEVKAKELDEEDKYGNLWKRMFVVDSETYHAGRGKTSVLNVKNGKDWHPLKAGDEVEFRYEDNEYNGKTYRMAKSSDITLVKAAGTSPLPHGYVKTSGETPAPKPVRHDVGIKVGHAINAAVALYPYTKQGVQAIANDGANNEDTVNYIETLAWKILKMSTKMNENFDLGMKEDGAESGPPANVEDSESKRGSTEPIAAGTKSSKRAASKVVSVDDDVPY